MKKKKEKKYRIKFSAYTRGGIKSSLMCAVSVVLILAALIISFNMNGNAGVWVGLFPLISFCISIYGFRVGIRSFGEDEDGKFLKYSYIGTISNAVVWLAVGGVFLAYV